MITHEILARVRTEIDRYRRADIELQERLALNPDTKASLQIGIGCIESAALKRASLDLSRALTVLRTTPGRVR